MTVGIRVGSITDEIGAPSFLHAFFSTISAHCDSSEWGACFPNLFELYSGRLPARKAEIALKELRAARDLMSTLPPSSVVWNIENRVEQPPWGVNVAPTVTSLGNYFVASTGRDLFELLEEALGAATEERQDVFIE